MFDSSINYNEYIQGEYSYWIDGPIWKFGESNTEKEQSSDVYKALEEIDSIVNVLSSNFSPTITFGARWFEKPIALILSICEGGDRWKEVKISVDRYEVFDSLNSKEQEKAVVNLRELFYKIALSLKPYYGIAATEIMGLVTSPEQLQIDNYLLGDFNYFDRNLVSIINLSDFENDHVIKNLPDGSAFLFRRQGLLELG